MNSAKIIILLLIKAAIGHTISIKQDDLNTMTNATYGVANVCHCFDYGIGTPTDLNCDEINEMLSLELFVQIMTVCEEVIRIYQEILDKANDPSSRGLVSDEIYLNKDDMDILIEANVKASVNCECLALNEKPEEEGTCRSYWELEETLPFPSATFCQQTVRPMKKVLQNFVDAELSSTTTPVPTTISIKTTTAVTTTEQMTTASTNKPTVDQNMTYSGVATDAHQPSLSSNYVGDGFQSHQMQLNTSILHGATDYRTNTSFNNSSNSDRMEREKEYNNTGAQNYMSTGTAADGADRPIELLYMILGVSISLLCGALVGFAVIKLRKYLRSKCKLAQHRGNLSSCSPDSLSVHYWTSEPSNHHST
ncbi:uncharacterized protein LOC142973846 [Anticarsia gemmatalis]|uniref:uncharacterized protein LOC142973846 n=1 Tax=Anticarsia gemmatalis TaxID=129554 RepID=UPI003F775C6E